MKTISEMIEAAKNLGKRRIVVAAAQEESVLEAIFDARDEGVAEPILVGDVKLIKEICKKLSINIDGIQLVEALDFVTAAKTSVAMVRNGEADVLMKGVLDTAVLLKAVLNKETGLNTGRLTSHVGLMEAKHYHKLFIVTDAAINIAPDLQGKIDILNNAVGVMKALGVNTPKVAMLAAVEKVNPKMPCTVDAAMITMMNKRHQIKGCIVDGPLALDNAISAESARIKKIESEVAGDADILIVPEIESGNVLYKSLLDLGGATGAGIVAGAAKPIVLTSRADSRETKLASIALAALASV